MKAKKETAESIANDIREELERRCAPPMSKGMYRDTLEEAIEMLRTNLECVRDEIAEEDES